MKLREWSGIFVETIGVIAVVGWCQVVSQTVPHLGPVSTSSFPSGMLLASKTQIALLYTHTVAHPSRNFLGSPAALATGNPTTNVYSPSFKQDLKEKSSEEQPAAGQHSWAYTGCVLGNQKK